MTLITNGTVSFTEEGKLDVEDRMTRKASLLAGYYLSCVVAVGFVVNVVVLNTFRRHPVTLPAKCRLLRFLCCCDVMTAVLSYPFICASLIANKWLFSDIGCQWYGFSMTVASLANIGTHACIALQRCYTIVGMRQETHTVITKISRIISIVVIIYALVIGLLPFIGVGSYGFEPMFWSCAPTWWSKEKTDLVFILILFVFGFVLPLFFIIFSYAAIGIKLFSSKKRNQRNRVHGTKIVLLFFFMIFSFLLSWGPYTVVAFLHAVGKSFVITPMMNIVPLMMAKSYILWDPLIYLGGNEQSRQALFADIMKFGQIVMARFVKCNGKTSVVFVNQSQMALEALTATSMSCIVNLTLSSSMYSASSSPSSYTPILASENTNTDEISVMCDAILSGCLNPAIQIETAM